jgi:hypothetical protein
VTNKMMIEGGAHNFSLLAHMKKIMTTTWVSTLAFCRHNQQIDNMGVFKPISYTQEEVGDRVWTLAQVPLVDNKGAFIVALTSCKHTRKKRRNLKTLALCKEYEDSDEQCYLHTFYK